MTAVRGDRNYTQDTKVIDGRRIVLHYWAKPIPLRQFDWEAHDEDYDIGDPIGHGATEEEALRDLADEMEARR